METQPKKSDFRWLSENLQRIEKEYGGKYIAIVNNNVAAVGDEPRKAYDEALKKYPSKIPLIYHARKLKGFISVRPS